MKPITFSLRYRSFTILYNKKRKAVKDNLTLKAKTIIELVKTIDTYWDNKQSKKV